MKTGGDTTQFRVIRLKENTVIHIENLFCRINEECTILQYVIHALPFMCDSTYVFVTMNNE